MDKPSDSITSPMTMGRRRFLGTLMGAVAVTAGQPLTSLQAYFPGASAASHNDDPGSHGINHFKAFNAALGVS